MICNQDMEKKTLELLRFSIKSIRDLFLEGLIRYNLIRGKKNIFSANTVIRKEETNKGQEKAIEVQARER